MRGHIGDTATLLLILLPFQPQRRGHYEAASNPRLFIAIGRVPITQLGEASYNRAAPGRINMYACWDSRIRKVRIRKDMSRSIRLYVAGWALTSNLAA